MPYAHNPTPRARALGSHLHERLGRVELESLALTFGRMATYDDGKPDGCCISQFRWVLEVALEGLNASNGITPEEFGTALQLASAASDQRFEAMAAHLQAAVPGFAVVR